ncbi:MAG: hypothetical protein V2I37_13415 [Marinilabiliaceae bacterium]|jgi:hypothetical protein|nr:hypothetical protein [Marinilabiliaceae bacterium]
MDDIGGIIFYIIAAVIGIIATVGNKKKAAGKQAKTRTIEEVYDELFKTEQSGGQVVTDGDFEEGFEDMDMMPESRPEAVRANQKLEFDINKEGEYWEPMARQVSDEGLSVSASMNSDYVEEGEIKENEIGSEQKILSEFDLKKAVIYSEILKRKYS